MGDSIGFYIFLGMLFLIIFTIKLSIKYSNYNKTDRKKHINTDFSVEPKTRDDKTDKNDIEQIGNTLKKNINNNTALKEEVKYNDLQEKQYYIVDSIVNDPIKKEEIFKVIDNKKIINSIKWLINDYTELDDDFKKKHQEFEYYLDGYFRYIETKCKYSQNNELLFPRWSFSEQEFSDLEENIEEVESYIIIKKVSKILIEIDFHEARKKDAEEILNKLMGNLKNYRVELTIIHGYNRGTILRDYIRGYNHPSIKSIEFISYNDGRTIYNIENEDSYDINNDKLGREIQFRDRNPNLFERRKYIEKNLKPYDLSLYSIQVYIRIKREFESLYIGIKARVSKKEDSEILPDYEEFIFDNFYFSKLGSMINVDVNSLNNSIVFVKIKIIIRDYINSEFNRILKLQKEEEREERIRKNEIEKTNRHMKLKVLAENFHRIKVDSIIYHKERGVLTVIALTDSIIYTTDSNGDKRKFICDPKILDFVDDIKY